MAFVNIRKGTTCSAKHLISLSVWMYLFISIMALHDVVLFCSNHQGIIKSAIIEWKTLKVVKINDINTMYMCLHISNGCVHLNVIWEFRFKGIYKSATLINHEPSHRNERTCNSLLGDKLSKQNASDNVNVHNIQIQISAYDENLWPFVNHFSKPCNVEEEYGDTLNSTFFQEWWWNLKTWTKHEL